MPIFRKDDGTVAEMLDSLQREFECYQEHKDARLQIDIVIAYADRDPDTNERLNDALKHHGCRALGIAKIIGKKDRAMGRGDAEIALDGDHWETITEEEQRAILDHELYHIVLKRDRDGNVKKDDMRRPMVKMRPHDHEFGWFETIAARHGSASIERRQAAKMMEEAGQYYWPGLLGAGDGGVTARAMDRLRRAAGKGGKVTISSVRDGEVTSSVTLGADDADLPPSMDRAPDEEDSEDEPEY